MNWIDFGWILVPAVPVGIGLALYLRDRDPIVTCASCGGGSGPRVHDCSDDADRVLRSGPGWPR